MAVFKDIYEQYGKPVYLFLLKLTGSTDEAEELLSETFYQAFLHMDGFEGKSSLYTWLCQIGKHAWLKECRRRQRFDGRDISEIRLYDKSLSPEEQVIQKDERKELLREVYELKDPYREVFMLHVFGGVKLKEIAAACNKSEEWSRVTFYRAKNKIVKKIACKNKAQDRGGRNENGM